MNRIEGSLNRTLIDRPRVASLVRTQFDLHDIVQITAFAGAGKSVVASQFASSCGWPVARIAFRLADGSCERIVLGLGQALSAFDEIAPQVAERGLDAGLSCVEIAAGLAECVPDRRVLILIDNAEALVTSDEGATAFQAFLDYLPTAARVLLVGRDWLDVILGRLRCQGRVGRIDHINLAFDLDETRDVVRANGERSDDAEGLLEVSRGWAAGILFDLRAEQGLVCPSDLSSYLNQEVLRRVPSDERLLLLRTSGLEVVTSDGAVSLAGSTAPALLGRIIRRALPLTPVPNGFVLEPWFRRFLVSETQTILAGELVELGRRHARYLSAIGLHELAVERLLEIGELDEAAECCELALDCLYDRADWVTLTRWLDQFGVERLRLRPKLLGAHLRLLVGQRHFTEAEETVASLAESGELETVVARDPGIVATLGMSYRLHPARGAEAISAYVGDHRAAAVRYGLRVISGSALVAPPPGMEWGDLEQLMTWGLFLQGRLDTLSQYLQEASGATSYLNKYTHALLGEVWRGNLGRAREICDAVPLNIRERTQPHLWRNLEAWISLGEGDVFTALDLGRRAIAHSQRTGEGAQAAMSLVVGSALIRLGDIDEALALLGDVAEQSLWTDQPAYVEWANTYRGLALLRDGQTEAAAQMLSATVVSMQASGRNALLPGAAAYLSEAEWRKGDSRASDEAASLAIESMSMTGAVFPLTQALLDLPAIGAELLSGWAANARTSDSSRVKIRRGQRVTDDPEQQLTIYVRTFGSHPDICVGGVPQRVRRRKVIELAAYLAVHGGRIDRQRAQLDLFPEHDLRRGSNYFRQIVHQFRMVTGVTLMRPQYDVLHLPSHVCIDSVDCQLERLIKSSAQDALDSLEQFVSAASQSSSGYLPASDLEWVEERRAKMAVLRPQVCLNAAAAALDTAQAELAEQLVEQAIAEDPYSERGYEMLAAVGRRLGSVAREELARRRAHQALGRVLAIVS